MKQMFFFFFCVLVLLSINTHAQRTVKSQGIRLKLISVKVQEDTLFFHLQLSNRTLLRYHLNQVRCYTEDRSTPKRTAVQQADQEPLEPLHLQPVEARSTAQLVIPYSAFTVPENKNLFMQVAETRGTRGLRLKISGKRFRRLIRNY